MQSGLASSLEERTQAPTLQAMQEVCRPAGMRAKQLSRENGWQVKQIIKKYRNPNHAPDTLNTRIALAKFEQSLSKIQLSLAFRIEKRSLAQPISSQVPQFFCLI